MRGWIVVWNASIGLHPFGPPGSFVESSSPIGVVPIHVFVEVQGGIIFQILTFHKVHDVIDILFCVKKWRIVCVFQRKCVILQP